MAGAHRVTAAAAEGPDLDGRTFLGPVLADDLVKVNDDQSHAVAYAGPALGAAAAAVGSLWRTAAEAHAIDAQRTNFRQGHACFTLPTKLRSDANEKGKEKTDAGARTEAQDATTRNAKAQTLPQPLAQFAKPAKPDNTYFPAWADPQPLLDELALRDLWAVADFNDDGTVQVLVTPSAAAERAVAELPKLPGVSFKLCTAAEAAKRDRERMDKIMQSCAYNAHDAYDPYDDGELVSAAQAPAADLPGARPAAVQHAGAQARVAAC